MPASKLNSEINPRPYDKNPVDSRQPVQLLKAWPAKLRPLSWPQTTRVLRFQWFTGSLSGKKKDEKVYSLLGVIIARM